MTRPQPEPVSGSRTIQNLALIGFMGTGKSSVGRVAAELLGYSFVDTDQLVEARTGLSIKALFAQSGEGAFREWETRVLKELDPQGRLVIATGGGLPTIRSATSR